MRKAELFFNVLRLPVDFLMLLVAGLTTYFLRTEIISTLRPVLFEFNLPFLKYFYLVIFVSLLFLGAYAISGLYSMRAKIGLADEFFKIVIASSAGILLVIIYIFLRQELFDSRFLILGGWFFAILFVCIGRFTIRQLQRTMVAKYNFGVNNIMVIGDDEGASVLCQKIKNDPASGYRITKQLSNPEISEVQLIIDNSVVDEIILAHSHYSEDKVIELVDFCNEHHIVFKFVPNISQLLASNFSVDIFEGLPFIEIRRTSLDGWGKVIKQVIDFLGAIVGLIVCMPIFGLVSFAIKWETEGPVFAKLKRVSKNKEFNLLKFRSMIDGAEELKPHLVAFNERSDGPLFKIHKDPRVTKVGRLIRKIRVDELPQLWNVLKGEISLVGPRPHQPDEIAHYQKHHKKVLAIKAGATGLAQVSGSSDIGFEQEVALDSFYVDNWSLWLDVKIILKTILKMFFDKSAV